MRITVDAIWENQKHIVFAPACYRHGLLTGSNFQNIKVTLFAMIWDRYDLLDDQVEGVSAQDQLMQWLEENTRVRAISYCDGVNCQPSCPAIETGPHTWCIDQLRWCDHRGENRNKLFLITLFLAAMFLKYLQNNIDICLILNSRCIFTNIQNTSPPTHQTVKII